MVDTARSLIGREGLSYSPALTQMARWDYISKHYSIEERGDAVDQFKMIVLYPIERAYDYFMEYIDLLNENKMFRFERKHNAKRMMAVFDDYQRRRDRLSNISAEEFSDIVDLYEEEHKKMFDVYRWQLSQSFLDSGIEGTKSEMLRCLFSVFCMLRVSIEARGVCKARFAERIGWVDYDRLDFIDYVKAIQALDRLLTIETSGVYGQLDVKNVDKKEQAVKNIVTSMLRKDKFDRIMERVKQLRESYDR